MIRRDPQELARISHDLVIVGGGVFGIMLGMEASRRNLRWLLLEQGDFGGETSYHHHRILHGGLRYLQSLDLGRFRQSVQERKWFLKTYPNFTTPLPCLMPLYGEGLKRPVIFQVALGLNNLLSSGRNRGLDAGQMLPDGKLVSAEETQRLAPGISGTGLKGGAIWYDGSILENQRILMETLRWGCAQGGNALNYVRAESLSLSDTGGLRVRARDVEKDEIHTFQGRHIINAAGPWCREVARRFDAASKAIASDGVLMWNLLVDRLPPSRHALALFSKSKAGGAYFLHPWKDKMLIGTGQMPWTERQGVKMPGAAVLSDFIQDINGLMPELKLKKTDILRVFAGVVPGNAKGELRKEDILYKHSRHGGPEGLYSLSGVKFTTARAVADKALSSVFPGHPRMSDSEFHACWSPDWKRGIFPLDWEGSLAPSEVLDSLDQIRLEESVLHLDDLLLRRCSLGDNPARVLPIIEAVGERFAWDPQRLQLEMQRVRQTLKGEVLSA